MASGAVLIHRIRICYYLLLMFIGLAVLTTGALLFAVVPGLPRVPVPLSRIIETPPSEIYAATGEHLLTLGGRETIPLSRVSPNFLNAVIATEDHRFWKHHGMDKLRTVKALWVTFFEKKSIQGASTITQQLAKNLFFSPERSYSRKFQELLVSLQIEAQFSKQEILEAYMNQISFGVGAYGIERAARTFFDKPAMDLTLAESALLAGLPKSPTQYNPYRHYDKAKKRQEVVLARMVAAGYISKEQAEQAAAENLKLSSSRPETRAGSYFVDMVIKQLEEQYGPHVVYHGGLRVTTTLDPQLQAWATTAVSNGAAAIEKMMGIEKAASDENGSRRHRLQAALVAVETHSGAVKAVVGGRDYSDTQFNRAVQSRRLPGSGFKPFLYYAAFEKLGLTPASVMVDKPVMIPIAGGRQWRPRNFKPGYEGPMVLKRALMDSVNSIAAQLAVRTGPQSIIETARRCGIQSPLTPVYSLAMGTSGVSPLEMASAFSTFATGGVYHEPFWIRRVEDVLGRVLEEHIDTGERRLDAGLTCQIVDMMRGAVDQGTGETIRRMGFGLPAAGKTGTSNDFKDAWFTGFTPTLCASVWVGYDHGGIEMRDAFGVGVTGGRGAAPIWADFMEKATRGAPPREFPIPSGVRFETIDPTTGRSTAAENARFLRVVLLSGQTAHGGSGANEEVYP